MRIAFDTNVMVYAEGADDATKAAIARTLFARCNGGIMQLPLQVILEGTRVLQTKFRLPAGETRAIVHRWQLLGDVVFPEPGTLEDALKLAFDHDLQIFDAMILATAAQADCRILLSEDFQDGFVWRGVTVANPFAEKLHPLLASALND